MTILSGDLSGDDGSNFANNSENSYQVVVGGGTDATAFLDGFTITGGNANGSFPQTRGGGMYNENGSPTVSNCTFIANTSFDDGGGMGNLSDSSPIVANCAFMGNTSGNGGAMSNINNSNPTVTNCAFIANSTSGLGGAMYNTGGISTPSVTNCTFAGNSAGIRGGGIFNSTASPSVTNCTFSGNSGGFSDAGGISNLFNSAPTVTNCVLWNNTPRQILSLNSTPVISYCNIQSSGGSGAGWDAALGTDAGGNLDVDPVFADADGADDTIGTEDDDLRLSNGSPCIDAADNTAVPVGVVTDFDGNDRFVDDGSVSDTGVGTAPIADMGAFEAPGDCNGNDTPDQLEPDTDGDGIINDCDDDISGDMNCDGALDFDDVAPFVLALTDPAAYAVAFPACNIDDADMNGDTFENGDDLQMFFNALIGP